MDNVAKAFNGYANEYDRWFETLEGRVLFEMEVEAVRLLMKGLEKPFLEIGVGTGRFAKELGIDFGIDPSHMMLERAMKRGIKVKKAEGEKLPFKENSFGGVFIVFTLCFVDEPGKVLSEAKRVLKHGGGLIVGIINRESTWGSLYMKKGDEGHPIYKHARFYNAGEVTEMLKKTGFTVDAYSSTLCQPPSAQAFKEDAHAALLKEAGFICIRASKPRLEIKNYEE